MCNCVTLNVMEISIGTGFVGRQNYVNIDFVRNYIDNVSIHMGHTENDIWAAEDGEHFIGTQTVCHGSPYIILFLTLDDWITTNNHDIQMHHLVLCSPMCAVLFIRIVCNIIISFHNLISFVSCHASLRLSDAYKRQ